MQKTTTEQPSKETDQHVVSMVNTTNKGGRPTLYTPETVDRLLTALADGVTQKQACLASGISESTLSNWKEQYPELEQRLASAREQARQKALTQIRAAGEAGDWRASEAFLRMSFPADYRRGDINVSATAVNDQRTVVVTEVKRRELQAKLRAIQDDDNDEKQSPAPLTLPAPQTQLQADVGTKNSLPGAPVTAQTSVFIMPGGKGVQVSSGTLRPSTSPTLKTFLEAEPVREEPRSGSCVGW
jgi:hypothetical protein